MTQPPITNYSKEKRAFITNCMLDAALDAFCPESLRHIPEVRNAYRKWAVDTYAQIKLLEERCPL